MIMMHVTLITNVEFSLHDKINVHVVIYLEITSHNSILLCCRVN